MSYILEALKKAEQKREVAERPRTSVMFSGASETPAGRKGLWVYVVVVVALLILLNGAFLVRWFMTKPADKTKEVRQGLHGQNGPHMAPSPVAHDPRVTRIAEPEGKPEPAAGNKPPAAVELPKAEPERKNRETVVPPAKAIPEEVPPKQPAPSVDRRVAAPSTKLHALNELPPEIKSDLPDFKISGHAYSDEPQTRVVRINEKILQEGQELSAGLRLDEVTPTGVILSYKGYRFRVTVNQVR